MISINRQNITDTTERGEKRSVVVSRFLSRYKAGDHFDAQSPDR